MVLVVALFVTLVAFFVADRGFVAVVAVGSVALEKGVPCVRSCFCDAWAQSEDQQEHDRSHATRCVAGGGPRGQRIGW